MGDQGRMQKPQSAWGSLHGLRGPGVQVANEHSPGPGAKGARPEVRSKPHSPEAALPTAHCPASATCWGWARCKIPGLRRQVGPGRLRETREAWGWGPGQVGGLSRLTPLKMGEDLELLGAEATGHLSCQQHPQPSRG